MLKSLLSKLLLLGTVLFGGASMAWGAADVTYDFTGSDWTVSNGTLSNGTVSFTGAGAANFKMNSGYFMMGKSGAYLNFPTYNSPVSKIVITGRSGASASVGQNIFVGDNAVSTATTGATDTNTYDIASDYQAAGTQYTLKVTSNHNTQITKIEVYFAAGGSNAVATSVSIDDSGITNTDIASGTAAGSLSATVSANNSAISGASVTWSGDNDAVATINASTGAVTLVSDGTVTFTASYAGVDGQYLSSSQTYQMTVTDSRYSVSDLTFTAKCGGSGTADDGAVWTVTSDAPESDFGATSGIHYGTNSSAQVQYVQLNTSDINGTVSKVVVNARDAQACAAITVTVGGASFTCTGSNTATNDNADFTFTGTGSGEIVVLVDRGSAMYKAIYVKSVKVYYNPSNEPSITASNVNIAYDATQGEISYTINNPGGSTLTAAADANDTWISNVAVDATNNKVTFTTTANTETTERTGTITLTYGSATKNVTVTQAAAPAPAVVYTTIPDLFAAATTTSADVNVTFGNWVVSGVNGKTAYVTDNSGNGFIIYTDGHGFNVNDKLSGTVNDTPLKLYKGAAEFTALTANDLTVTNDGAITVITNKTIADLGGVNTGAVITLSNLTYDGTNLSDGTNTIVPYSTLYAGTFESGKTYNVTGVYLQYDSKKELLPRSAADIEEVVVTTPSITADNVNIAADATNGEIAYTISNPDGSNLTAAADANDTWISNVAVDANNNKVTFDTEVNTGDERTGTITLTYGSVTKDVTVTQAKYVAPALPLDPVVAGTGCFVKVTSTAEITDGHYLIVYEGDATHDAVAFDGSLDNLDQALKAIDVTIVGGKIEATQDNAGSYFTIRTGAGTLQSASGLYIGKTAYANGLDANATTEYTNTFAINEGSAVITAEGGCTLRYNYASDNLRFRYYKTGQQPVQLYKYDKDASFAIEATVTAAGWATFVAPADVEVPANVTAYIVSETNTSNVKLTEIVDGIPAGVPVLLEAAAGTYTFATTTTVDDCSANKLLVSNGTSAVGSTIYVLGNKNNTVGFYRWTGTSSLSAGKVYLNISGNAARDFLSFETETTGIANINVNDNANSVYDMQGRRVAQPTKGLYIVNGRKVVVK